MEEIKKPQAKDFASDLDIKWCPGCGDYSILKQVQSILPETGINREDIVFVSGIGCSSRFPYYMNTYGMHSIHGRAPSIAMGIKLANPNLSVWITTGDGDSLSIGGNHLIHIFRRNIDVNIILFNNEIYGLTKGQYSPTSNVGLKTKTSPLGVIDHPFNPISLALGADASFIARGLDRDSKLLRDILLRSHKHKGTSFLEIYQNCLIFNNGVFEAYTDRELKDDNMLLLEHGKPLIFGKDRSKGIILDGLQPRIVNMESYSENDCWIHNENDKTKAFILSQIFDLPGENSFPRAFGIFYEEMRNTYNNDFLKQIEESKESNSGITLNKILKGEKSWLVS